MSTVPFFSFGPDDSFISKSYEGLRYRGLHSALHRIVTSRSVVDVHWAALGPVKESWVLSFTDTTGKQNLGWGQSTPSRLQAILETLNPDPHLRVFLGPLAPRDVPQPWRSDSFIAWSPTFISWGGLTPALETCIQSWLTPAGWKDGPPRIVTWGTEGAYIAMSEYGKMQYSTGRAGEWPTLGETLEEWAAEAGFDWSEIVYISLDPTTLDQFVAIRQDGTWAGAADGSNVAALESFVSNFFFLTKSKTKSRSRSNDQAHDHQTNDVQSPEETIPDAAAQALYENWSKEVASKFASASAAIGAKENAQGPGKTKGPRKLQVRNQSKASIPAFSGASQGKLLTQFPYIPAAVTTCSLPPCVIVKADASGLRACEHDVERLFRASGLYSREWLRQERLRWHPDRFGRLCEDSWRETGRKLAEEMFKIIDGLIEKIGST